MRPWSLKRTIGGRELGLKCHYSEGECPSDEVLSHLSYAKGG
jgi:hypothetical protein